MKKAGDRAGFTIAELVKRTEERTLPVIAERAAVEEVISAFADSVHTRVLYVLDGQDRLAGIISLGQLVRHFFRAYHEPLIHPRRLMGLLASETAGDLMRKEVVSARLDEEVEEVLQRMIRASIKEIAVLDEEGKLVADLTMVDILRSYEEED